MVETLRGVDLLVLDEIQVRSDTEWENSVLTDLIDSRYAAVRSTLLIANLERSALAASLGDSVASRLEETGTIIPCDWPSFRRSGAARPAPEPRRDASGGRFEFTPVAVGAIPTPVRP